MYKCKHCGGKLRKDGTHPVRHGSKQRYKCGKCGRTTIAPGK